LANCRLKSFNPENPDSTMNNDIEPRTTPTAAISVMIFIALFLLFENKYLLAM